MSKKGRFLLMNAPPMLKKFPSFVYFPADIIAARIFPYLG
jgi:hypothetical protein